MPQRQKKSIFFALIATILSASFSLQAAAPAVQTTGSTFTHRFVTEEKLRAQVEFLCDSICGGRATGTVGCSEASSWLIRHFRNLDMSPRVYSFTTAGGKRGRNVVGMIPGAGKSSYIIIVAHYDGLGRLGGRLYPGADSDCSGVAAMLGVATMTREMARIGKVWRKNILFVALDGKNAGLSGSKALWDMLKAGTIKNPLTGEGIREDQVSLMVNIDQIGSTLSPIRKGRQDYLIMLSAANADYLRSSLRGANQMYRLGMDLGMDYYGSRDFTRMFYERVSDQRPFVENGRKAVMFTSGITMNNNKVYDSPHTLDYTILKKRIWLIFHWMERVI